MFTEEFLDSLPTDTLEALARLCYEFEARYEAIPDEIPDDEFENLMMNASAVFEAFLKANKLPFEFPEFQTDDFGESVRKLTVFVSAIRNSVDNTKAKDRLSMARSRYSARFEGGFIYEFSDDQLQRIQQLLNELRAKVQESDCFDAKHRQRVLARVESVQREMHKKMTSLDRIMGFISDAGVVSGKFGRDVKPITDRMIELGEISCKVMAKAEGLDDLKLPWRGDSATKQLPSSKEESD